MRRTYRGSHQIGTSGHNGWLDVVSEAGSYLALPERCLRLCFTQVAGFIRSGSLAALVAITGRNRVRVRYGSRVPLRQASAAEITSPSAGSATCDGPLQGKVLSTYKTSQASPGTPDLKKVGCHPALPADPSYRSSWSRLAALLNPDGRRGKDWERIFLPLAQPLTRSSAAASQVSLCTLLPRLRVQIVR